MNDEIKIALREAFESALQLAGAAQETMVLAEKLAIEAGEDGHYIGFDANDAAHGFKLLARDLQETLNEMSRDPEDDDF